MKIVRSAHINYDKWDTLVNRDENQRIFGWSKMISAFAEWDALVIDDYSAAVALPKKRKWCIPYLIQPPFIQYQSFWGDWSDEMKTSALKLLKKKYLKGTSSINDPILSHLPKVDHRPNLILPLDPDYATIFAGYSKDLKKTLRKEVPKTFRIIKQMDIQQTIKLYQQAYGAQNPNLTSDVYLQLHSFLQTCIAENKLIGYSAMEGDSIVASILLLKSNHRLHYTLGAPTEQGRKSKAIMRLLDHVIQEHAQSSYFLDFEGSKIPSVAKVYRSYGSIEETFYTMRW